MAFFSLILSLIFFSPGYASDCTYGVAGHCTDDQQCLNFDESTAKCLPIFDSSMKTVLFPFEKEVICDQGNLSPDGNSHTWVNSAYALDLTTKFTSTESGNIRAGAAGKVIAYSSCTTKNDNCGTGFGNHIKILTDDGFILFYAHLDKVNFKTGDLVSKGAILGTEGDTGLTGKDNRHLHFSVHHNWKNNSFEYWESLGYLPPSVPFKLQACTNSCGPGCATEEVLSTDVNCLRTNPQSTKLCGGSFGNI